MHAFTELVWIKHIGSCGADQEQLQWVMLSCGGAFLRVKTVAFSDVPSSKCMFPIASAHCLCTRGVQESSDGKEIIFVIVFCSTIILRESVFF